MQVKALCFLIEHLKTGVGSPTWQNFNNVFYSQHYLLKLLFLLVMDIGRKNSKKTSWDLI